MNPHIILLFQPSVFETAESLLAVVTARVIPGEEARSN